MLVLLKDIECFDIALIHDTRTGSDASPPQVNKQEKRQGNHYQAITKNYVVIF